MVADELGDCVVSDLLVHDLTDKKATEVVQYYFDVLNEKALLKGLCSLQQKKTQSDYREQAEHQEQSK